MSTTSGLRVLAALRLSDDKDESTSIERQLAIIEAWANANGHVMAGKAEDVDVSGGMDPFERPELGPWLQRPKDYDIIASWKLDRLTRRSRHFAELREWAEAHKIGLVSVTEGFDLSTPMGRMFAGMIAMFAEAELETITERVNASHKKLRAVGRYAGGSLPFGYTTVPREGGGKVLAPDPEYAPILTRMVDDTIKGQSSAEIARKLNEQDVMSWHDTLKVRRGGTIENPQRWTSSTVLQILKNPAVAGYRTTKTRNANGTWPKWPTIVRDDDDEPVMATETPIVPVERWKMAVAAIESRSTGGAVKARMPRSDTMLQGVIKCASCGRNLYAHFMTKTVRGADKVYAYYACGSKVKQIECLNPVRIGLRETDREISDALMTLLGGQQITREETDPGEDYSSQIEDKRQRLDILEGDYLDGKYDGEEAAARYHRLHAKLSAQIDALMALPRRLPETRIVGTGETYGERWGRDSDLGRRDFLLAQGIGVVAYAPGMLTEKTVLGSAEPNTKSRALLEVPERLWAPVPGDEGYVRLAPDNPL